MQKPLYRGRKKYSEEEAGRQIESCLQMYYTNIECIHTWKTKPVDKLIEALCKKTTKQFIDEAEAQNKYIESQIEYMRQFAPNYEVKGSFAFFSC